MFNDYELLDSGNQRKLERFGEWVLDRPASQAVWRPQHGAELWGRAHAVFDRSEGHKWTGKSNLPESWVVEVAGLRFRLSGTDFGHLGIFPEQRSQWAWLKEICAAACTVRGEAIRVLNLFAYSGGSTLAAAAGGAAVCHLDASRGMVQWARENAALSGLGERPIRWMAEDVFKFLAREERRGNRYDGIVLDPPSFGRGTRGEVFKIEEQIGGLLDQCVRLLSPTPSFILLSAHTPGFSPVVLHNLLADALRTVSRPELTHGEMLLTGAEGVFALPSGAYATAHWTGIGGKT